MSTSSAGFKCVKVIALSVRDLKRADQFYEKTLGLEPAYENKLVGSFLDSEGNKVWFCSYLE